MSQPMTVVAYLAPELPALSATFVYEELLGIERRGVRVVPVTVRRPAALASGQGALVQRTHVLYGRTPLLDALGALAPALSLGAGTRRAFGQLVADMRSVGPLSTMAFKLAYQWLAGARLARLLRRESCTHLHVHFAHTPAQIAMYASAFSGIPFTIMAHANDIFERGLLLREKAQRATKLLTISQYNVGFLRSVGVDEDKLAVVRCGVSLQARTGAPVAQAKPVYQVGALCRLIEKKGIDDLLVAMASLHDAPWDVELSIAGEGPMRGQLEAQAKELRIEHKVRFIGAMGHADVTPWLQGLDVFALPCKKDSNGDMDGIPVVLMEAMSQRVPVVSTRLSGIPELVRHEQTGLLATPADPQSLAAQLRRLLDDPTLRESLSVAALRHVQAEFDQEVNLDRLLGYFQPSPTPSRIQ